MSRNYCFLFIAIFLSLIITQKVSADEYGDRFYNQTPVGMAEYPSFSNEMPDIAMDDIADELQNIKPAAGIESNNPIPSDKNIATENQNVEEMLE